LIAREKPYGDLTHSGLFIDRDRDLTLKVDESEIARILSSVNRLNVDADITPDYSELGLVYRTIAPLHVELNPDTEVLAELEHRLGAERTQVAPLSVYSPMGLWKLRLHDGLHERVGNVVITFRLKYFEVPEVTRKVAALLGVFTPFYQKVINNSMNEHR
jgi:hypothetical protein